MMSQSRIMMGKRWRRRAFDDRGSRHKTMYVSFLKQIPWPFGQGHDEYTTWASSLNSQETMRCVGRTASKPVCPE